MGGNGGGGFTTSPDYITDAHRRLLEGYSSAKFSWQEEDDSTGKQPFAYEGSNIDETTDVFAENPSLMRFIYERGLSDRGGNPYEGINAYNPDTELGVIQDAVTAYSAQVATLDPDGDVTGFLSNALTSAVAAKTSIDADAFTRSAIEIARLTGRGIIGDALAAASPEDIQSMIEASVDAFARRELRTHLRSVNRFSGGMADIGAVNSSAYIIGLAMMERDYEDRLSDFRAKLTESLTRETFSQFIAIFLSITASHLQSALTVALADNTENMQYMIEASKQMLQLTMVKNDGERTVAVTQFDASRAVVGAKVDEQNTNLEYDVKDMLWDIELFQSVANVLSASNGSVVPAATKPSRTQSILGGMASGASKGIGIGSAIPGVGSGIGAGVGALLGAIGGAQ